MISNLSGLQQVVFKWQDLAWPAQMLVHIFYKYLNRSMINHEPITRTHIIYTILQFC